MAYKKIKKSITLTSTFIILLLIMGMFFGMFTYISSNTTNTSPELDSKYSQMRDNLTHYQENFETQANDIKDNLDTMEQSEPGLEQVWNGIKGLGQTIVLMKDTIPTALGVSQSLIYSVDIIPTWGIALIYIGILIFMVLLIISILKGDPKM